ncbi:AAA family ATPase [Bradyrhizobium sp.]|uniref:AAA family ATPase n=1 Tax=Bradyrhizobium sp. TaxID=376 RepID=UPI002634E998|nr:AAA family ATPase [Bradyrhizobium sp.]
MVRIARASIENFRGLRRADVHFSGTSVLLGDNNTGKSTIFEAIELAIGPDRLARTQAIDEHDFYGGDYLPIEGAPAKNIVVEVVIVDLDVEHCTKFRNNLEFWREADRSLLGPGHGSNLRQPGIEPAVRIRFEGAYDPENDDFTAKTWFAVPRHEDGAPMGHIKTPAPCSPRPLWTISSRRLPAPNRALL